MTIQITIRGVREKVRAELSARAALQGKSMQEFLLAELEWLACGDLQLGMSSEHLLEKSKHIKTLRLKVKPESYAWLKSIIIEIA